jgi:signal peptidase
LLRTTSERPFLDRRSWRNADLILSVLLGILTLSLLTAVGLLLTAFQVLIVRSGSMSPAIDTGDVIVTKEAHPGDVRVGDIITFRNPAKSEELLTHRVMSVTREGESFSFVTRGDRNTGEERWSIDDEGRIGLFKFRVRRLGYALAWVVAPRVRAALVAGAALVLGFAVLRRIWRR